METTLETESTAIAWYLEGIKLERKSVYYMAISCYKKALKLDPDVEKKIDFREPNSRAVDAFYDHNANNETEKKRDKNVDLFLKFQSILGPQLCFPNKMQQNTHFSSLPLELVLYIFRWVVSSNLDLRSLEQCAAVCRGWYLCARDPDLWRRACSKFWPPNVNELGPYNGNWRQMFIERPNVLTIGCYICKVSYVRRGEESFRDNTNGPSFNVDYYRYLRFFSDGHLLMVIRSNEQPNQVVRILQTSEKPLYNVIRGYYQLSGNKLFLTLGTLDDKRVIFKDSENNTQRKLTSYKIVLEISKFKSKPNWKLHWIEYECRGIFDLQVTKFELPRNRYPPFIFSRVKCYSKESKWVL